MNSNHLPVSGGLAVFIAVVISYFVIDPAALEGIRPGSDSQRIPQVHGIEDVQARLWQDPFAAVAAHRESPVQGLQQAQLSGKVKIPGSSGNEPTVVEIKLEPYESKNQVSDASQRHGFNRLTDEISAQANHEVSDFPGVTVLAVMVSAGPYAKQAETRKRMRYAVLSGLGASDFFPLDSGHIGYVDDLNRERKESRLKLSDGAEQLPLVMPYEWFSQTREQHDKRLLLLWLDEDAFAHKPLTKLDELFSLLGGADEVPDINLIGPWSSDTLKKMVQELDKLKTSGLLKEQSGYFPALQNRVFAYSATATAVDSEITSHGRGVEGVLDKQVFKSFERTIKTDDVLAGLLHDEIEKRVPPQYAEDGDYDVAIISEWDTDYGKALPKLFDDLFEGHVRRFTYMRGIDGALAEHAATRGKDGEAAFGIKRTERVAVERPEGGSQKDYLRRLADHIYHLNLSRFKSEGKGIRAVGVLGSDVYDKLLILRVLRERFPKAVFFTTDLDAALLHPDQYHWVRNLVVASAYGLSFGKYSENFSELSLPPFRDSYQTSVYLSTRLSLASEPYRHTEERVQRPGPIKEDDRQLLNIPELSDSEWLPTPDKKNNIFETIRRESAAKIYEIGRNQAIDLLHSDSMNLYSLARYLTAMMLIVLLAILFWRDNLAARYARRKTGKWYRRVVRGLWIVYVAVSIAAITWISVTATSEDEVLSGILMAMMFLTGFYIYFYLASWRMLRPWREFSLRLLDRKLRPYRGRMIGKSIRALWQVVRAILSLAFRPLFYGKLIHLAALLMMGLLIAGAYADDEPFSFLAGVSIWPTEFLRLVAVWLAFYLLCHGWESMRYNGRQLEKNLGIGIHSDDVDEMPHDDIRRIWSEHISKGGGWQRVKRVWLPTALWMLTCLLVFRVQSPNIPFRGHEAFEVDVGITILAYLAFFILFGFVLDSVSHFGNLIRKLIRVDTLWPLMADRQKGVSDMAHQLTCGTKREWREIQLIAVGSEVISRTVYYPIYIILLLLAAQSDYFDNWDMPYTLMLIATLNVGIVLWSAISLRRFALLARRVSLDKLRHVYAQALDIAEADMREHVLDKVAFYREEIENIKQGAFLPISEQPWLRALTLMTGGGSSILLLQYLAG